MSAESSQVPPLMPGRIRVGAAYYAEYQPYERLEADLDLMVAGGFSVIRVGESVWSTWEPRDGEFELDWLAPVLDAAHRRGIAVIVGTPTYAAPPWLRKAYPETTAHIATGAPMPYGARQDVDYAHPTFRRLAERVVRAVVQRYADHPAVVGWQVDNEPGHKIFFNPDVFASFVASLEEQYGTVDELNRAWGLTYWSHRIAEWDELWTPDLNTTPAYDLAWRRHQARLADDLIAWQADVVREYARPDQFVMTCIAPHHKGQDISTIATPLDLTAVNIYYATQDALTHPGDGRPGIDPDFVPWTGPAFPALQADLARSVRDEPFLVTESNATSIGGSGDNLPCYDGQWRQAGWLMVARGARMLEYWHWATQHYGAESYWGGILGHSLEPGRTYHELSRLARELDEVGEEILRLATHSDVGLLVDPESRWALEFQGPLAATPHSWTGDRTSYEQVLEAFYRSLFDAGLAVDVVAPRQLPDDPAAMAARWPVLVVPALYVASDRTLELLAAYAEAGGHLMLTPRTGYATEENVIRPVVAPGVLRGPAGVSYLEYTNLAGPVPLSGWPGAARGWADGLLPEDADVLAGYDHPHLRQFAAVVTHAHGAGRVTTVGTLPDRELGRALGDFLASDLPTDAWREARPADVTVHTMRPLDPDDGGPWRVVHHWDWGYAGLEAPTACVDVLSGERLERGDLLRLGPWDVRVLREEPTT
ncbi:beta-galactosidase [Actinotalea sp. M2MS4P-6]|uniref:beta-galactosidase n=1 Tax=Actinotalea sp. M2MS4P-6 TaxID=2983762 RepID=UPI0021E3B960|nr:beta-galactosidase [Actinotalea sp. M2MS4P-6]MCV2394446.1 beta-galactosidase [Actinotalea sp. M2MS4P-6]